MTGKELVKLLKKNGWELDRIAGSHHIMVKDGCEPLSVPVHDNKAVPTGLLRSLLKRAGL